MKCSSPLVPRWLLGTKAKILNFSLSRSLENAITRVITIETHTSIRLIIGAYDIYLTILLYYFSRIFALFYFVKISFPHKKSGISSLVEKNPEFRINPENFQSCQWCMQCMWEMAAYTNGVLLQAEESEPN